MYLIKSRSSWLLAPIIWLTGVVAIIITWLVASPEWVMNAFDQKGESPIEIMTIALFYLQIGLFWLVPPIRRNRHPYLWLTIFSIITMIAIARELDWHRLMVTTSDLPGSTQGTPFKMRFLTNSANPLGDRLIVLFSFVFTITICGGTLLFFLKRLWSGLFKFHPVSWSIGFLGGTTILVQFFDRMPSVLRKKFGIVLSESPRALFAAMEEGQELLLPLFVILATLQAHFIYNNRASDNVEIEKFKEDN